MIECHECNDTGEMFGGFACDQCDRPFPGAPLSVVVRLQEIISQARIEADDVTVHLLESALREILAEKERQSL